MELTFLFLNASLMALSHCVGMCGGVVLAYCQSKFAPQTPLRIQLCAHTLYNLGRVSMYVLVGFLAFLGFHGLLEVLAKALDLPRMRLQGGVLVSVGVLMALFALGFFLHLKSPLGLSGGFFAKGFKSLFSTPSLPSFYALGLLNGLLPCGMVYWFVLNALARPNLASALEVMLVLGLATFAPMFVFGALFGNFLSSKWRAWFQKAAFVLLLGFAGHTIYMGAKMLGHA
ncbi:sulfite exporter TauE/SafE family protein [Helicobacter ailurogastricus]|uniref:Membrane protein, putative n=1 Tax=Helicobacter ailurogastricus TaxID=1578720 RepID=A0A0K2Y5G0_9HELI|nr:sulfite exporter TauE/SafE family protein [Helicobacter ailurogastricus]BDQ28707.1 membrane protein [Helicobacter ailurogastricus]CRI32231.1 membrane protein, putative [Helicobacter ailurogastricus]